MRRRKPPQAHLNQDRWLVSYADFITLLFAFFTTMYAISTIDARKLSAVVDSMQAAFAKGDVPSVPSRIGAGTSPGIAHPAAPVAGDPQAPSVSVREVRDRLESRLSPQVSQGLVDLEIDPRGLVISIKEAGSFATGSAELSLAARGLLHEVAGSLQEVGNLVRVEGHTDDVPIHTARFSSNWELSTARATVVVAYFIESGVWPTRLCAAGYAEFHPRQPNDSDASRARNRRVDVVVLNPVTVEREEPGSGAPPAAPMTPPS